MIFIIPIILGAAAIVSAGVGVSKGVDGFSKMQEAESIGGKIGTGKRFGRKNHPNMMVPNNIVNIRLDELLSDAIFVSWEVRCFRNTFALTQHD